MLLHNRFVQSMIILSLIFLSINSAWSESSKSSQLHVHFIDIGQGDAALIQSPSGKTILVDSGPSKSWRPLQAYLDQQGIKTIDLMINSHPHADHIGNAARVIEKYKVKMVLDSGFTHPIRAYRDLLTTIEENKVKLKLGRKGRKISIGGDAFIEILAPEVPLIRGSRSDANSNSIVFKVTYGKHSVLFTGDAEEETEHRLLTGDLNLHANILKVAHHGSRHASSRSFLNAVEAQFAVISCSQGNRYGHPADETLDRLRQNEMQIWVTARQGTLKFSSHKRGWMMYSNGGKKRKLLKWNRTSHTSVNTQSNQAHNVHKPIEPTKSKTVSSDCIKINQADANTFKTLKGIGATLSKRIVDYRKNNGVFKALEDLKKVKGIGTKKFAGIQSQICL